MAYWITRRSMQRATGINTRQQFVPKFRRCTRRRGARQAGASVNSCQLFQFLTPIHEDAKLSTDLIREIFSEKRIGLRRKGCPHDLPYTAAAHARLHVRLARSRHFNGHCHQASGNKSGQKRLSREGGGKKMPVAYNDPQIPALLHSQVNQIHAQASQSSCGQATWQVPKRKAH